MVRGRLPGDFPAFISVATVAAHIRITAEPTLAARRFASLVVGGPSARNYRRLFARCKCRLGSCRLMSTGR